MTEKDVLEIINAALRAHQDARLSDVTTEQDDDIDQVIITTEGEDTQVWVLDSISIRETDPPSEDY